ncbi:protein kintoun-like [Gigantopelta aegis]|uniref:protein kintoun-like n=1 Tax=Gigantopelta aegis TaxID=1735272 RepID=UPI001B88DAB7|nr:protein kintoun-like [Gigantopelta aegis]
MFANTMASKDSLEDLDLKPDELKRITEALKDEKFRKLFVEYAEEISDPENRRRYEEEIRQMENERGMDVQFIHPKPGHVLKTTVNGTKLAFINICLNDKIEKPSFEPKRRPDDRTGMFCQIPHSFAPEREDVDEGTNCVVFDFVIHPDTYRMAETNDRYLKMIYDVAFDGIEEKFNTKVDRKNFKRIKLEFKGIPQATVIRTRHSTETSTEKPPVTDDVLKNMPYPYDSKTTAEKTRELEQQFKKRKDEKQKKELKMKKGKTKEDSDATTPKYTITHRSEMDLQEYCNKPDSRPSTRPKALVFKIELPLLSSAAPVNLDIFEQRLVLESVKPARYKLDIRLPYPVNDDEGSAKFDKAKHCLIITLPVIPDVIPKLPSFIDDESQHNGDAADTSADLSTSKDNKSLIEELPPSLTESSKDEKELKLDQTGDYGTEEPSKKLEKEMQVAYSFPDYDFSQDNDTVSFVFNVKRISPETVTKSFPSQDSVTLKFVSVGSGYFPMYYSVHIKFGHGCDIVADQCSVETSEQNAVLLLLKARNCRGIWDRFQVGLDADHLEEKLFVTEDNLQQQLDAMDREAEELEQLKLDEDKQPQVQVTEMNEKKLTIQIKSVGIPEDADNDEYDGPSSADIEVIHEKNGPKLQSILKQRTLSESSDDYGENSRLSPEDELSLSLNGRFRKSVSFNNHIDKTTYKPTASPTSMKTALKSKRRRARKKDEKINKKVGRRRHNSGGSEGSSGDDLSSEHTNSDSQTEDKNGEFEQIDEEAVDVAAELQLADVLPGKDNQDFRTSGEVCVGDSNLVDLKQQGNDLKQRKNDDRGDECKTMFAPDDKMATDSDDDDDDVGGRTSKSVSEVEPRTDGHMYSGGDNKNLDGKSIKTTSAPVIDAQIVSSEDVSRPGSLKQLVEEDGSSFIRINANYNKQTDQHNCDNMQPTHKQNGENNNKDPDDDNINSELSWKESEVPGFDNEHRTQCAFKFSNSLIYDLDID